MKSVLKHPVKRFIVVFLIIGAASLVRGDYDKDSNDPTIESTRP